MGRVQRRLFGLMALAQAIEPAVRRALEVRGTIMVAAEDDPARWCAAVAAVDGRVELRVGEPRRGRRFWSESAGERWLGEHGFVQVIDAWAHPAPRGTSAHAAAAILAAALEHGMGVDGDASTEEVLTHPGTIHPELAPPSDAPHEQHIRRALLDLAEADRGKCDLSGGRPADTWAWVFAGDGRLFVEPEAPNHSKIPAWEAASTPGSVTTAAERLTRLLHDEFGHDPADPLFIGLIGL